jgi:hypothetical protein
LYVIYSRLFWKRCAKLSTKNSATLWSRSSAGTYVDQTLWNRSSAGAKIRLSGAGEEQLHRTDSLEQQQYRYIYKILWSRSSAGTYVDQTLWNRSSAGA